MGVVGVLLLVGANAFFVATEFAIVAVRRSRLEQLVAERRPGAKSAQDLVQHLDTYIAACQFGITLASLGLGWVGEPALAHLIEPVARPIVGSLATTAAHTAAIIVAFAIITALHIVAGELAPKGLALQRTEQTALLVAQPMRLFYGIFRWPIQGLNWVGNATLRLVGLKPASEAELVHDVAELRFVMESMEKAGVVEPEEVRMAARVFQFGDLRVDALMTPRMLLEAKPITLSYQEALSWARTTTHRRLLIYEESLDHVVGVIHIGDLFKVTEYDRFFVQEVLRPIAAVPASKRADELLKEMRDKSHQIAVVFDEYGSTVGIVTVEDLVEALVGKIDQERGPHSLPPDALQADGSMLLDGLMRLSDFKELLKGPLEETDGARTVGGLVMVTLGRLPAVGEHLELPGFHLRVEQVEGHRVAKVRLIPREEPVAEEPEEEAREREG